MPFDGYTTHNDGCLPMASQQLAELFQRMAALESQLAFQDDTIETLNQLLIQQAQEYALLQRQLQLLNDRIKQLSEAPGAPISNPVDEIPPHY